MTLNEQIHVLHDMATQVRSWPENRLRELEHGSWTTELPSVDVRVTLLDAFIENGALVRHITVTCFGTDTLGTDIFLYEDGRPQMPNHTYQLIDGRAVPIGP